MAEGGARLRVMTLVGTRPEVIKLSCVLRALDLCADHVLVHSGQNYDYELNAIFFDGMGLRAPDRFLDIAADSPAVAIARVIERTDAALAELRPDAFLVLGDTNSSLGVIAARKRGVPVFHMEAGNRCFDPRVPEEFNRRLVDHASDVNLVYTEHARRNLLAEGVAADRIVKTGSPMREVLAAYAGPIAASDVLARLGLAPKGYFVASLHREETVDDPRALAAAVACLNAVVARFDRPIVFSVHPRTRARLEALGGAALDPRVAALRPLGFVDYVRLQTDAACVLSDSGTLTEEAALAGFPAVMLREAHERPEGMDVGAVLRSDLRPDRVLAAATLAMAQADQPPPPPEDYANPAVARQVVRLIVSYCDVARRAAGPGRRG